MNRFRYPRTFHLPFSPGRTTDDVTWRDCSPFIGREVVVSEKLDGEATTIYCDGYVHARSPDSKHHPSRTRTKALASQLAWQIPDGFRICGENLTAWHSIFYTDLPSFFFVYSIYDDENRCLSWQDTEWMCGELGLHTVPVIYRGLWDETTVKENWTGAGTFPTYASEMSVPEFPRDFLPTDAEGYVVRLATSFSFEEFGNSAAKYVRPHHVTTDEMWLTRFPVIENQFSEHNDYL